MNDYLFRFDPNDLEGMRKICQEYHKHIIPFSGRNDNGENTMYEVYEDKIIVTTYQDNGCIRYNHYWLDGTREELFGKGM